MAERINLGQFDIDTRQIDEKIASNRQKIDVLKDSIKETQLSIREYQKQISDVSKEIQRQNDIQDKANQDLANGVITQDEYNQITQEASRAIRDQEVNLGNLIQAERRQHAELNTLQNDVRALTTENRHLNRALEAGATEISSSHGEYEQLKKDLADARQVAYDLGAEMMRLERSGETNTERYRQLRDEWRRASEDARELHDQILELETQTNDYRRNVGNYANGIKDAFSEIGAGFTMLLTGGFAAGMAKIKDGLKSVKDGLIAIKVEMMTNPLLSIGILLAALTTGFIQGMRAVFEYNAEISKLNKEIEQLTNLTGPVVDKIREFAISIERVFGKEFKEGIQEMNSLMTDFNLTSSEAFKIYQDGLVKGGAANEEFGDSIREYGVLFAQNGYLAQEFLDLLNAGIDLDIYTDKLPDAIKELGISLTDTTKATRDSLVNAFGASFADDLLRRVNSGKTTVKQALDEISAQALKTGLNLQQIASLNASVFRGAGEDAGGLVKIIEAVNLANSKEAMALTNSQKATIELADATVELEKAKTEAFKSDQVTNFTKTFDLAWTRIKTIFVQLVGGIVDVVLWFDKMTGTSETIKDVFNELVEYGNYLMDALGALKGVFNDLLDAIGINTDKTGGWIKAIMSGLNPINLIKGALTLLTGVVKTFASVIENSRVLITTFALTAKSLFGQVIAVAQDLKNLDFSSALNRLKSFSISDELSKARKEAEKIVALNKQKPQKEEEKTKSNNSNIKGNNKDTGASADAAAKAAAERQKLLDKQQKEAEAARLKAEKAAEAAAKQDLANAKERANIAISATQAELAEYIAMNAEKLKSDKRLTQARVNEIQKYLDDVREKMLKANQQEREQKLQSLDEQLAAIKGINQQELDQKKNLEAQKEVVRKEYDTKEIQIVNDVYDKRKELDKAYETQKTETKNLARALEYQKQIADLEKNGYNELAMQKLQLDQQVEQRLASFLQENELKRQLDQENYEINAEIEAQRRELENQIALEQDEVKKQNLQNLLSSLNIIQQDYANKEAKIAQEKELAKWGLASSVAMGMAKVAGEQTKAGKALAIAGATIDTIAGSVRALKDYPAPYSFILMGTTIAAGLAQVAKISGVDTGGAESGLAGISSAISAYAPKKNAKAADGMLIGPSHSNGGIPINTPGGMIEAEGGEVIINKRSSAMYRDVLSRINQLGGGVKFASGGVVGNISSLPTVQNNFKSLIDMDMMREVIGEAVLEGSLLGTQSGSQMGIVELSNNREIQNGANF